MANDLDAVFRPDPIDIKNVIVVGRRGRTSTYTSLLSAVTAVYQLSQDEMKEVEGILNGAQGEEDL